jgi:hypothetical protein
MRLRLHALDPAARYRLEDVDGGEPREATGAAIGEAGEGLEVRLQGRPASALLRYRATKGD